MKRILTLSVLFFAISYANGQGFTGQLIVGINGSQIEGDDEAGYYKAGLITGLSARFPLSDYWSMQPEILYSQKGSAYKIDKQTYTLYDLKYIEFPIVFRYLMDNGLALEAGPSIAVYLSGRYIDLAGLEEDPNFAKRFPDDMLGFVGMEFPITDGLAFNVRFTYSVLRLPPSRRFISRNNTLSFTLRIRLINGQGQSKRNVQEVEQE